MLWHCWLGDRKGIRPVKNWVLVCWWWWFDWSFAWLRRNRLRRYSHVLRKHGDVQLRKWSVSNLDADLRKLGRRSDLERMNLSAPDAWRNFISGWKGDSAKGSSDNVWIILGRSHHLGRPGKGLIIEFIVRCWLLTAIFQVNPGLAGVYLVELSLPPPSSFDGVGSDNSTTGAISRTKLQPNHHHHQQTNIQLLL